MNAVAFTLVYNTPDLADAMRAMLPDVRIVDNGSDPPIKDAWLRIPCNRLFSGGWNRDRANILFPLSSRHLMFTEIGAGPYPRRVPSRYYARLFRRVIAEHAHRSIYAAAEDAKVPQLKPRVVDAEAFRNERTLWETWYEDQSRAEQSL